MTRFTRIFAITLLFLALVLSVPTFAQSPVASVGGRFQFISSGTERDGRYLLDTQTGKIWREITFTGTDGDDNGTAGHPEIWVPMTFINSEKELAAFAKRNKAPDAKPDSSASHATHSSTPSCTPNCVVVDAK